MLKTGFMDMTKPDSDIHANNKDTDQYVHPCSLISNFIVFH